MSQATLRPPEAVMSPQRMAAIVSTPLSFPRSAMRELVNGRWQVRKLRFDLDEEGRGEVLYQLEGNGWLFHFFLISLKLDEAQKTDRNYAASWDAMGVLCQGEWTAQREAHLRREVPRQRAGFADYDTLMYARGNRSARIFDHVVDSLARGEQPDMRVIAPVGYILRTTAFIGNGQLGTRAFAGFEPDHPLRRPYHAQFCSGFMLREYVFDLVDHIARARSARAVRLAPAWRRYLGLGNSAATGLSAFAANHPHLMHQWTLANEAAIAQARDAPAAPGDAVVSRFAALLDKAIEHFTEGARPEDGVFLPPQSLAAELSQAQAVLAQYRQSGTIAGRPVDRPWAALCEWAGARLRVDAVEVLQAIALEVHPHIVQSFSEAFQASERFDVQPAMPAAQLAALVDRQYRWALEGSEAPGAGHYFWYRCASAPRDVRRGPRGPAPELEHETTFDTQRQVRRLRDHLATVAPNLPVADIVCARPDLRHIVKRVQSLAGLDYAELHEDFLGERYSPFASIRFPLTFFGMEKLEAAPPKSVRGVFLQGAPIAEDVAAGREGAWPFPLIPTGQGPDVELAPLPVAGLGALARDASALEPQAPHTLRLAPAELARMVQVAVQGHGASLGVAQDAGMLALMAHCAGEPAIASVLAHCGSRIDRSLGQRDLRDAASSRPDRDVLRAQGGSTLLAAPAAADLALARAARVADGVAACLAVRACDGWLAEGLALRCAQQGRLGLLCWHSQDPAGAARSGFALAWPGVGGIEWIKGELPTIAALHQALLMDAAQPGSEGRLANLIAAPGSWPDAVAGLLAQTRHQPGPSGAAAHADADAAGFALLVAPAPAAASADGLLAALRRLDIRVRHESAQERESRERQWQQRGVELGADEFQALARAGHALLVPQEDERRFLVPGFDPLKGF